MDDWAGVLSIAGFGRKSTHLWALGTRSICGLPAITYSRGALKGCGVDNVVGLIPSANDDYKRMFGRHVVRVDSNCKSLGEALTKDSRLLDSKIKNLIFAIGILPLMTSASVSKVITHHLETRADVSILCPPRVDDHGAVVDDEISRFALQQRALGNINSSIFCVKISWLKKLLKSDIFCPVDDYGNFSLINLKESDKLQLLFPDQAWDSFKVANLHQLSISASEMQRRICENWMNRDVEIIDRVSTFIDTSVKIAKGSVIYPNTYLRGSTSIGSGSVIGPNTMIENSRIGKNGRIIWSVVEQASVSDSVSIGPFSHIRKGTLVEDNVKIGNFSEIKKSRIGANSKVSHFSYLGDADIDVNVNIGAGVVTCNYDGDKKHDTLIEKDTFVGSGTMLIAPVKVGRGSVTGAGSVVNKDVLPNSLVVGVPAKQINKKKKLEKGN
jgi:bifunctional UDP-N-acetylglucosamine pyrophosphorylase/glucosamine-1-phosphate N-acetyltransferase